MERIRAVCRNRCFNWFRNTEKEGEIEWVPHFVDNDSGVGVEVNVTDLNGDSKPDIITSSKKGLIVHTQVEAVAHVPVQKGIMVSIFPRINTRTVSLPRRLVAMRKCRRDFR